MLCENEQKCVHVFMYEYVYALARRVIMEIQFIGGD